MHLFFDKDGTPLETLEWARKYEDYAYRFVGHDQVGPYRISTLWTGLPPVGLFHDDGCAAPRLVFQTGVFRGTEQVDERNYANEEDALAGHVAAVTVARATVDVPEVETPEAGGA
jgi:phosphoglycolate phosphatase-like HAD superfamily hydrolase